MSIDVIFFDRALGIYQEDILQIDFGPLCHPLPLNKKYLNAPQTENMLLYLERFVLALP